MKTKGRVSSQEKGGKTPRMVWASIAISAVILLGALRSPPRAPIDHHGFGRLPVLHNGRVKPIDSIARTSLLVIHGKQTLKDEGERIDASRWLLELTVHPETADARPVFTIHDPDLLGLLGFRKEKRKAYAFNELVPHLDVISEQAGRSGQKAAQQRTRFEKAIHSLQERLILYRRLQSSLGVPGAEEFQRELDEFEIAATAGVAAFRSHMATGSGTEGLVDSRPLARLGAFFSRYQRLAEFSYYKAVPPPKGASSDAWTSIGESLVETTRSGTVESPVRSYAAMLESASNEKGPAFDQALAEYRLSLESRFTSEIRKANYEAWFNRVSPFYRGMILYVLAVLFVSAGWLLASEPLRRAGVWALGFGAFAHTFGLVSRMVLEARPPVTNLYSSAVFVGWCGVIGGLLLERVHRRGIAVFASACLGFATLIIAHHLSMTGDTLEMMQAVLDSNFWLGTHVVTITIGYSATFLAGMLAHIYLFRRLTGSLDKESKQSLYQMTYGVICFALLFSFIGTILGGIWADQSWGRFWGWDPKENGAFLIVVWNAMILHARMAGTVRETGFMGMSVFGNIVTAFSWFGVNMLGIGLHSYGFMDKAFWWIMAFTAVELAVLSTAWLRARTPKRMAPA